MNDNTKQENNIHPNKNIESNQISRLDTGKTNVCTISNQNTVYITQK